MRILNEQKLRKLLNEKLQGSLASRRLCGAQLAIRQNGKLLFDAAVGYQNYMTREPLRENAVYRLASMTKPVTGVAALIALERGWFDLNDKVEDHLPQFADMMVGRLEGDRFVPDHRAHQPLRIWHLLSHCSGLLAQTPEGMQLLDAAPASSFTSIQAATDHAVSQPLVFDPTEATAYSGYAAFDTVARIIEQKSGLNYAEFLRRNIFEPLSMYDTTFCPTQEQWDRMIVMSGRAEGVGAINIDMGRHIFEAFPLEYFCAGAGLAGTIRDYGIFAEMLRCRGTYGGKKIFSSELMDEYTKSRVPASTPGRSPSSGWGLGVRVVDAADTLPIGTFGWSGAYGTHFWVDPENEITVVFMRNSHYDSGGCGSMGLRLEKYVMSCLED